MGAQFTIPLITVIPGQLIASALWNNEFQNINTNFIPAGMDSYSDTDAQMQIQTAPYPGSVTSHASNLGGEIERIRFQLAAILGTDFWYKLPAASVATMQNSLVPVGGSIYYPSATPPNSNWHLKDGTAIDRVIYASLFALIGTTFGPGDGTTSFNLPNSIDRMSLGAGNLYALAATGGAPTHVLTKSESPSGLLTLNDPGHNHTQDAHSHAVTDPGHTHQEQYLSGIGASSTIIVGTSAPAISPVSHDASVRTQSSTTGISTNNTTPTNQSN